MVRACVPQIRLASLRSMRTLPTYINWKVEGLLGSVGNDQLAWMVGIGFLPIKTSVILSPFNGFPKAPFFLFYLWSLRVSDVGDPVDGEKVQSTIDQIMVEGFKVLVGKIVRSPVTALRVRPTNGTLVVVPGVIDLFREFAGASFKALLLIFLGARNAYV